jgi:carbon starvation protein
LKNSNASLFNFLTNRWVASVIPAVIGIWLAWSGNFTVLWPSFGSANQLIASMALMTAATWVLKRQHVRTAMTIVPAYLLWITVTAAIIWFSAVVLPGTIKADPGTGITVMCIELVMLAMNIVFMIDFIKCSNKSEYQPASS